MKIRIPEGSAVKVYSNNGFEGEAIAQTDMEVPPNSILMIDGKLLCTMQMPVTTLRVNEYMINCWVQDCIYIADGKAYNSTTEL
jgi:hypothetical protein